MPRSFHERAVALLADAALLLSEAAAATSTLAPVPTSSDDPTPTPASNTTDSPEEPALPKQRSRTIAEFRDFALSEVFPAFRDGERIPSTTLYRMIEDTARDMDFLLPGDRELCRLRAYNGSPIWKYTLSQAVQSLRLKGYLTRIPRAKVLTYRISKAPASARKGAA